MVSYITGFATSHMFPNLSQMDLVHTPPSTPKPLRVVLYFRLSYQHLHAALLLLHK